MHESREEQSRAERAIGPTTSSVAERGRLPSVGTRPLVGFRPVTPLAAAGDRMEPAVSVPSPPSAIPAATAIAVPELEPSALYAAFQGLVGIGKSPSGSSS